MVLNAASAALLGGDASKDYEQRDSATGEKRTKLRRYEHVAPQVLNVGGVSPIHECSNKALWSTTTKGNKSVAFYSEFCSKDAYRQGIAGSRHAETYVLIVNRSITQPITNSPPVQRYSNAIFWRRR